MTLMQPPTSLSIDQIEGMVKKHLHRFQERGVLGLGVSDRGEQLRFVVRVGQQEDATRLGAKFNGQSVEGLPVHVEVNNIVPLSASPDTSGIAVPSNGLGLRACARWLADRPGYLVLGALAAIVVSVIALIRLV